MEHAAANEETMQLAVSPNQVNEDIMMNAKLAHENTFGCRGPLGSTNASQA